MGQIFISYSRADKDFVDSLTRDIEDTEHAGFDVWIDRADISGGEDWNTAINEAISKCSYFLVVLSPNSAKSKTVGQELSVADECDKRIIPLMYQIREVPAAFKLTLGRLQQIDFTEDYSGALQRLRRALGQQPQAKDDYRQPQPPPPRPAPQLSLAQVLPGQWVATAISPLMQITASVWVSSDGSFQAQQTPFGWSSQGRWSVDPSNQVYMQGMVTSGFTTLPFVNSLRVLTFDRNQINGIGPNGEQAVWRRVG